MIASVHIADVGARASFALTRKRPKPANTPGLRHANIGIAAPLSGSVLPRPNIGRVGLVALWDDDAAVDRFLADAPLAAALAGGWHVRLAPLRAFGSWPGLPGDVPSERATDHHGRTAVLTLGRLRMSQLVRFLRTSARAEASVVEAPGLTWATGLAQPPWFCTCSLWEDTRALSTYAYGQSRPAHHDAIVEQRRKDFHHQSAFIRFRPYDSSGGLAGRNPLVESWLAADE